MNNLNRVKAPPFSIVMIAYNEEKTLARVIKEYYFDVFKKLPSGSEFVLYLDKPTDNTPKIARQLAKKYKIKLFEGEVNLKYAGALKAALSLAKNNLIFFSDSSGKHKASDFWSLLPFAKDFDIVNGERLLRNDSYIRQLVTVIQQRFVAWFFQIPLHDYNAGFKIYKKSLLNEILPAAGLVKYTLSTEIMVRSLKKGYKIKDVPVTFVGRAFKKTGTQFYQLISMSIDSFIGYLKLWQQS